MKRLVIGTVVIATTVGQLAAQDVGMMKTGAQPTYFVGSVGLQAGDAAPLVISNPSRWGLSSRSIADYEYSETPDWKYRPPCTDLPEVCHHGDSNFPDWGYASDPAFYPNNKRVAHPLLSRAIVTIPVILQPNAPAPPTPATLRSEVHEYTWQSSASDSSATTFSIVSKDGRVRLAVAVWLQGDALCYYAPDHSTGRIPLDSIDREATRQRNAEQQLSLSLPPNHETDLSLTAAGQ
jgi:hypothetical protein